MDKKTLPRHIAIIPDGNRRWAREKGLPILKGHQEGVKRTFEILTASKDMGIEGVTLWGFSTENWNRGEEEVDYLMEKIFVGGAKQYAKQFLEEGVRFRHFGRKDRLPKEVLEVLEDMEEKTKHNTKHFVNLGADYGGRDEIVRTTRKIVESGVKAEDITEELFEENLDTVGLPNIDFIIRTSGEKRLSGLLPWQSVYAELYFPEVKFPDFTVEEFKKAIDEFSRRSRRFGGGK